MLALIAALVIAQAPATQPQAPQQPATQAAPEPSPLEKLKLDAAAVRPLAQHDCVRNFLDAASVLPDIKPRVVYYQRDPKAAFSEDEAAKLPEEQRKALRKLDFDTARYYDTFYGSPLAYSRALDLCAAAGFDTYADKKIIDYGYGTCGHLRILSALGARTFGVDVDPILRILYSQPGDQGEIAPAGKNTRPGTLKLVDGFWPGSSEVRTAAGDHADLFISKNTLKNGYVHPAEGVDKRRTLTLGVTDDEYIQALYQTVNSGGLVMIYNIGPAPAPEGKPVIPWADIKCPFPRAALESAGFTVIAFDKDDTDQIKKVASALGWDKGGSPMDLENDLFASYTLLKKP